MSATRSLQVSRLFRWISQTLAAPFGIGGLPIPALIQIVAEYATSGPHIVKTVAGGRSGYRDETGTQAYFSTPTAVLLTADGKTLLIADTLNHRIRRLDIETSMFLRRVRTEIAPTLPPVCSDPLCCLHVIK